MAHNSPGHVLAGSFFKELIMKKIVFFIMLMLPVAVLGQTGESILNEMPAAQVMAIGSIINSLPQKDSLRYIIQNGDSVWEKKDTARFFEAVVYKALVENTVTDICGLPFGSSYETARNILDRKYGRPTYSTQNNIMYKSITYGGVRFDDVVFFFQHDGNNSYLNQIIFVQNARSWKDAVQIKDGFRERLSRRYSFIYPIDEELTVGGLPPAQFIKMGKVDNPRTTAEMGFGFEIKIISQNEPEYPYFVRIMYGPYEYVNENF